MTMLLGGAKLLKKRESQLKGTVKLIFQPAEEGGAGGERMVKEGVCTLLPVISNINQDMALGLVVCSWTYASAKSVSA